MRAAARNNRFARLGWGGSCRRNRGWITNIRGMTALLKPNTTPSLERYQLSCRCKGLTSLPKSYSHVCYLAMRTGRGAFGSNPRDEPASRSGSRSSTPSVLSLPREKSRFSSNTFAEAYPMTVDFHSAIANPIPPIAQMHRSEDRL